MLFETAAAPTKKGNRWLVKVAVPGQGSSGFYSEELIREQGPAALHPGAQSFILHENTRNPKDMIGVFTEGSYWDEDEKALMAELDVFPHWAEFVETLAPHVGMSIYMAGAKDKDGNVTELTPSPGNGCDMVSRPGLAGSGITEKLYEEYLAEARGTSREDDKAVEELEKKVDALTAIVSTLVDGFKAKEAADKAADEAANEVETAVEAYDAAVEKILEAKLAPAQTAELRARAKAGEDVTEAIESAKTIAKELTEQITESLKSKDLPGGRVTVKEEDVKNAVDLGKVFG